IKRVLLAIFALLLVRVLWLPADPDSRLYFWVSAYMLEFLYGVLIYLYQDALCKRSLIPVSLVLVVAGLMLGAGHPVMHDTRVLYFGISAAAIVALALQLEANGLFKAPGWLVTLG